MPVLILKEGASQTKGRDAQKNNITAAKLISAIISTSLGPRGMHKMLVDNLGDVTITNDGATILKEIDVQHPAAKMMVEISKSVDNEVGDGTTSSVVLAGALIEKAEELLNKGVHPTVIVDGYRAASEQALKILQKIAVKINTDRETLTKIAITSLGTKLFSSNGHEYNDKENDKNSLKPPPEAPIPTPPPTPREIAEIIVECVLLVAEKNANNEGYRVDIDDIKVDKKAGGSLDIESIKGIVLDKEVVHAGMPKRIEGAKIVLLNSALEIEKTEMSAEIRINDPQQMQMFLDEENRMLKSMVDKIMAADANVVLCQKGIDDIAQHYLSKGGILAVRRIKESDMFKLSKATGARMVNNIDDLVSKDLGSADVVEERKVETDKWVFIEGCKHPKSVTILIRGGSQRVVDEAERSIHDAIMVTKDVLEKPAIVAGGGSPEAYISNELRHWSSNLEGREQLAIHKFADALDSIPLTLAENAGMDPIDTMTNLRARQSKRGKWIGVDVRNKLVADMFKEYVLDPLVVKEQIIKSATEVASMILRIDDVIASSKPAGGGMTPAAGGMEGMNY